MTTSTRATGTFLVGRARHDPTGNQPPTADNPPMLSSGIVQEIDRLLRESDLSQRQIAARVEVSRGIVSAIARGLRGLHGREATDADSSQSPPARCARCGYRVYSPCLVCQTRAHRARQVLLHLLSADRKKEVAVSSAPDAGATFHQRAG